MTYTFKLSRRLARLRVATAIATSLLVLSCSTGADLQGPESPTDPRSVVISPDSSRLGVDQAMQFQAILDASSELSSFVSGKGKGRQRKTAVSLAVDPVTSSVAAGATQRFSAIATLLDGSTAEPSVAWTATGGTVDATGRYAAGKVAGNYHVVATTPTGMTDTAVVTIATIAQLVLSPASVSLPAGGSQQFITESKSADGVTVWVSPTYTATGGTISAAGIYTAGQAPGTFRVISTDQSTGIADTSSVAISAAVASVTVSPSSAGLTPGQTTQLTATLRDGGGALVSGQSVSWTSSNTTAATVSTSGMVTAVSAGSATIKATSSGSQGDATINVTTPAPPAPPTSSAGCPTSGYLRLVDVSTQAQLAAAINAALPGDQIRLAAGTYAGGLGISRNGTSSSPITLCGPRTAIISNGSAWRSLISADWWILKGFKITGGTVGLFAENGNNNVFDSLLIEHVGQEAIMLSGLSGSSYNTVIRNTIRYTGENTPVYGEGVYIGDGRTMSHPSNFNRVLDNAFGPNITAEHVQTTGGTTGNLVQGNISDATGFQWVSANVVGVYVNYDGTNTTFLDNVMTNVSSPNVYAYLNYHGSGITFRRNKVTGTAFQYGFGTIGGSNNVIGCDNTATGDAFANIACQ